MFQILRSERVEFLVAPYEADAQLAYFSSLQEERGGISAIITEDSDLVAYGCPAVSKSSFHDFVFIPGKPLYEEVLL
jgi:exonuclease 1